MLLSLRAELTELLQWAINVYADDVGTTLEADFVPRIDYPPDIEKGHYSSPMAMQLAKPFKSSPRKIAESIKTIIESKQSINYLQELRVEGPGFLNFYLNEHSLGQFFKKDFSVNVWLADTQSKNPKKIIFEFVSANPTGPLNIVSARAAAVGDSICRVLQAAGHNVYKEYYVNDYGNQVQLLGLSFAYRALQQLGCNVELPENCYQGEYITEMTRDILAENIPANLESFAGKVKSAEINEGSEEFSSRMFEFSEVFSPLAIAALLNGQKQDLENFKVKFDNYFSEKNLHANKSVEQCFTVLQEKSLLYEKDSAWFFKSTEYNDDKDRVVRRADGRPTYLLADIAYHKNKIDRGFDLLYNIWGPDHHGYIARLTGAVKALGFDSDSGKKFEVLIVQQVNLLEDGKPVVMSKRLGKFQTMRDLLEKIPIDVSRYFFVTRGQNTHLDFDLQLATDQSSKNPVYYIQYAHARIHSIFRECGFDFHSQSSIAPKDYRQWLPKAHRDELLFLVARYTDEVSEISNNLEIQRIASYVYEVATLFTKFYHNKENRIVKLLQEEDKSEGLFLLAICRQTASVLKSGLSLLAIDCPEKM